MCPTISRAPPDKSKNVVSNIQIVLAGLKQRRHSTGTVWTFTSENDFVNKPYLELVGSELFNSDLNEGF